MILLFYFIPFLFSSLGAMERELPVSNDKEWRLIDAVCKGFIDKPFARPLVKETSHEKYIFACLKCDKVNSEEKQALLNPAAYAVDDLEAERLCNVGYFCQFIARNIETAQKYYLLAAHKGHARAYYYLGMCYEATQKEQLALGAYQKAADLGYEPAFISLASFMYKINQNAGIELYKKADALRRAFFKDNVDLLEKNENEDALIGLVKRGLSVLEEEIDHIPYLHEKAILDPAYALLLIKSAKSRDAKDDLSTRTFMAVNGTKDSDLYFNRGVLCQTAWQSSKSFQRYKNAFDLYKAAGDHALAMYELGLMYLNHEKETSDSKEISALLRESIDSQEHLKSNPGSLIKIMGNGYILRAANKGHALAQQMVAINSLRMGAKMSLDDIVKLKSSNYTIEIDDLPFISDCMKRFIKEHAVLKNEELIQMCTWFEFSCSNISLNEGKKDKAAKKLKKKNDQKISDFKKQCQQWVKEINDSYQKHEKQKEQAEKRRVNLEKEQQKKLLKADASKHSEGRQAPSIKSVENEDKEIINPLSSQGSPNMRVSKQSENEIAVTKKPKVKTRPLVSEQPKVEETPQDRPSVSAKPPLIRQMSAVALVRKNSKTDLSDPKYKRLVKRLSCSDLISRVKLDEMDIKRTLEELDRRQLIEYRNEKTTLTATSKINDKTPPLVIHKHGDWASNMDIVKQFLQFVYNVDSEYWESSELLTKSKE